MVKSFVALEQYYRSIQYEIVIIVIVIIIMT